MVTAVELVRRGARQHATRTAVHAEGRSLTFREVDQAANRFSRVLSDLGLRKGDHLALLLGNGLWSVSVDFACLKLGLVRVPLNPRLSPSEHAQMLTGTSTTWLLHSHELAGAAEEMRAERPGLRCVGLGGPGAAGGLDLLEAAAGASADEPRTPIEEDDPMLLLHTSGTTGTLKAATHTQGSYAAIASNILTNVVAPRSDSVMLHAASLIHASGTFVLPYWIRGATSVILPGFDPAVFLQAIAQHRVTEINLVPTMLGMIFAHPETATADISSLRTVVYGASPMPRALIEQAMQAWGPIFLQYYGQTEVPLGICVLTESDHRDPSLLGSCGQVGVEVDVRLVDDDGHAVAPGDIGEVQVRAPSRMSGYHRAGDLDADTITIDGWVRTRDMAYSDERGYLFLVDRRSDMIITGGYNVYPREVEDALSTHPAVAECAVVGAPDPVWVEAVTAFVSLKPGCSATAAELADVVRSLLAGYKVPKRIEFVDEVPTSAVGKILRRVLREQLWAQQ